MCLTWDGAIANQTKHFRLLGPRLGSRRLDPSWGLLSLKTFQDSLPSKEQTCPVRLGRHDARPPTSAPRSGGFSRHAAGARSIPACTAAACAHATPPPSGRGKIPNTSSEESRREAKPSFQAAEARRWLLSLNLLRQRWVRTTRGGRHFPLEHGRLARTCAEPRRG